MYVTGGSNENCFTESLVGALGYDAANGNLIADVRCVEGLYVADNRDLSARRFMRYRLCATCRSVLDNGNRGKEDTASRNYCKTCDVKDPELAVPEWYWTIDTDMSFQSYDVLYQMLAHADPVKVPILSALYFGYMGVGDGTNVVPVWFAKTPDGRITNLKNFHSGLNELGVVGMGCCLIHRSVFEKFGTTFAHTGWLYFGHDTAPWVPEASIDNDMTVFGEDNCFCFRAMQLGIPIYGLGSLVVEHKKKRYESMKTFLASFAKAEEIAKHAEGTALRLRREDGEAPVGAAVQGMVEPDHAGHQSGSQPNGLARSGELAAPLRGPQL